MADAPRIVLVGCGHWGRNIARVLGEAGALAAVCDADRQAARAAAEPFGAAWGEPADSALVDPGIVGIAIATPAVTHAGYARQALLAGKDVFVEKPIALTLAEAQELAELAEARGCILMVGHLMQYHPAFQRMQKMVADGELGRLRYAYSNRLNMGRLRREENVLWSFAPHDISMILSLAGEEPERVLAVGHRYLHKEIDDITVTHIGFRSGFNAHIYVSWLHPFKDQKMVVVGEGGMVVFDDTQPASEKLKLYRHRVEWRRGAPSATRAPAQPVPVEDVEPLRTELKHFLSCVETRERPRTDAREATGVLQVLDAAQRSLDNGAAMRINSAGAEDTSRAPYFVHKTAVIDPGVEIGPGSRIWHFSHVLARSRIGANCVVGQNVMIGPDVTIGERCKIQNNVSVYKGVTLEDDVFCGPSAVFTNVRTPRANVERKDEFVPTLVKRGATVGANATVICGTTIGEYAMIGAGAVVTKDVPAHSLVVGNPARHIGYVSASGERLGPDLVCPRTGARYRETQAGVVPAD